MRIDLHTHSTASDGTDTPAALLETARDAWLDVIGLTGLINGPVRISGTVQDQDGLGTTRAVAIAATPSPRPVSPSPSVVVAETVTGAPQAAESTAWASSRRGPSFGRLPIT